MADVDQLHRTISRILGVAASAGLSGGCVYAALGAWDAVARCVGLFLGAAVTWSLARTRRDLSPIGHLMALIMAAIVASSISTRGARSLLIPTLSALPLLTMITSGRRAGYGWSLACVLMIGGSLWVPGEVKPMSGHTLEVANVLISSSLLISVMLLSVAQARTEAGIRGELEQVNAELERRNRQLEDSSHARSVFLASMNHEIRTPLHGLLGCAELAAASAERGRDDELAMAIRSTGERLGALIDDVLDLSGLEADGLYLEERAFVPSMPLQVAAAGMRPGHPISPTVPTSARRVLGDPERIRGVLQRLIDNAVRFAPDASIDLDLEVVEGDDSAQVLYTVRDDGDGISADLLERLFDPFGSGGGPSSPGLDGSGIGLAVARGVARAMGGELSVHSLKGRGTTAVLELTLPWAEDS